MTRSQHPTAWLWWLSLFIAAAAAAIVYGLSQDVGNINADTEIRRVIMGAIIAIGICIISATSHWWVHR